MARVEFIGSRTGISYEVLSDEPEYRFNERLEVWCNHVELECVGFVPVHLLIEARPDIAKAGDVKRILGK